MIFVLLKKPKTFEQSNLGLLLGLTLLWSASQCQGHTSAEVNGKFWSFSRLLLIVISIKINFDQCWNIAIRLNRNELTTTKNGSHLVEPLSCPSEWCNLITLPVSFHCPGALLFAFSHYVIISLSFSWSTNVMNNRIISISFGSCFNITQIKGF